MLYWTTTATCGGTGNYEIWKFLRPYSFHKSRKEKNNNLSHGPNSLLYLFLSCPNLYPITIPLLSEYLYCHDFSPVSIFLFRFLHCQDLSPVPISFLAEPISIMYQSPFCSDLSHVPICCDFYFVFTCLLVRYHSLLVLFPDLSSIMSRTLSCSDLSPTLITLLSDLTPVPIFVITVFLFAISFFVWVPLKLRDFLWLSASACSDYVEDCGYCHNFGGVCNECEGEYILADEGRVCGGM